jgi:hypothetical protein
VAFLGRALLAALNLERRHPASRGAKAAPRLSLNDKLGKAAELHASLIAKYYAHPVHRTEGGYGPGHRAFVYGYHWSALSEHVAADADPRHPSLAGEVLDTWLEEMSHRALLLDPKFTQVGIGVAEGADGHRVWSLLLGAPGNEDRPFEAQGVVYSPQCLVLGASHGIPLSGASRAGRPAAPSSMPGRPAGSSSSGRRAVR